MVIKGNLPQQSLSRSRSTIVYRYMADGRIIAQKWPRQRGNNISPVTQAQVVVWDAVQVMVKSPAPIEYALALTLTKGTAFYARDVLIMCAYGHFLGWPGYGPQPAHEN